MRGMGMTISTVRAGHANMFLSPLFAEAFASLTGAVVELHNTDGSQGAARGAGIGAGLYQDYKRAFVGLKPVKIVKPDSALKQAYGAAYKKWQEVLNQQLGAEGNTGER